jgi:hypothetical protein
LTENRNVVGPYCTSHGTSSPAQKNPASASMELQKVSNGHEYETLDKGYVHIQVKVFK